MKTYVRGLVVELVDKMVEHPEYDMPALFRSQKLTCDELEEWFKEALRDRVTVMMLRAQLPHFHHRHS